jgi:hypothetical protein
MVSGGSRERTNEAIIRRNLQGFDGESAPCELPYFRQILFHCVPLMCAKALTKQEGQKRLLGVQQKHRGLKLLYDIINTKNLVLLD